MKVKIEKLGINGEGVCRITQGALAGKVCFVPFTLPNEVVDIEVESEKKNFCTAISKDVLEKSLDRITPHCSYFGKCGGCNIQHIVAESQKKFKQQLVKETLSKFLKKEIYVDDVVSLNEFGYRNKMVFAVVQSNGRPIIGMFEDNSHRVVDIDQCLICDNKINKFLKLSKEYFLRSKWTGYDFIKKQGDIKYLCVRVYGEQLLVTIVSTKELDFAEYYAEIQKTFNYSGLSLIISDSDENILSGVFKHLFGLKKLAIEEFGIHFNLDNRGFFQVNNDIKRELYLKVLDLVDQGENVIDAYCGAGVLSAILSKKCSYVVGIEICKESISSAQEMTKNNKISNVKFVLGDVKTKIRQELLGLGLCTLILDPPKSGCHKDVLDSILDAGENVKKIIYISCNPATLGRDLSVLSSGFDIQFVKPMDMFPQTKHVETLVVLERIG